MKALYIYEKVCLITQIEQRRFFNYLNDTIAELAAMYPDFVFIEKTSSVPAAELDAIVDEINEGVNEIDSGQAAIVESGSEYVINEELEDYIIQHIVMNHELTYPQMLYILSEKFRIKDENIPRFIPIGKLSDEINVLPLYETAIVDNILFLIGQEASYKSEFMRKADLAHRQYWSKSAKGKVIKRLRW